MASAIKIQRDLNRDYGNGPAICDEPLRDLKLDKSIDAEIAIVFNEVGHIFPTPIYGEDQLSKILDEFRKRGYLLSDTAEDLWQPDEQLAPNVWAMQQCSHITILQFRAWFQTQAIACRDNLRVLISRSRYVSDLVNRVYFKSEDADDKMEGVCEVMNILRYHLEEKPISSADIQMTARQVIEKGGKMLVEDFEVLVTELLVQLYHEHFKNYLYCTPSNRVQTL